jgi:hypothetical protein
MHFRIPAARSARVVRESVAPKEEGAGNAGCALHPRSRVQNVHKNTHTSIQVQRKHSGIPRAMVLRLIPRSPRRRIRLVTVAAGLMAPPIRSDQCRHRQLDTSNGCQNHTVLPYAATRLRQPPSSEVGLRRVKSLAGLWRRRPARGRPLTREPALRTHTRRRCRVHRILSRVRDDRDTPLLPGKDGASW